MKRRLLIIGLLITTVGFVVFGIKNKQPENKSVVLKTHVLPTNQSVTNIFSDESSKMKALPENEELWYSVKGSYGRPVTKEKLVMAKSINDIISDYPTNMIADYISVEIISARNDKEINAISPDNVLSTEQKNIFKSAEIADDIVINVNYQTKNVVSHIVENCQMKVSMTVVPEIEAEFIGGYDQMIAYLKENSSEIVSAKSFEDFQPLSIFFTVNEEGETNNVKLNTTSGNTEMDTFLVDLVTNMPKWKPAENKSGLAVKQQFEFNVGTPGC